MGFPPRCVHAPRPAGKELSVASPAARARVQSRASGREEPASRSVPLRALRVSHVTAHVWPHRSHRLNVCAARIGANKPHVVAIELVRARAQGQTQDVARVGTGSGDRESSAGQILTEATTARPTLMKRLLHTHNLRPLLFIAIAVAFAWRAFSFSSSLRTLPLAILALVVLLVA